MNDYKEKLKKAKNLYETANTDQRFILESLFPELAESEDERIRKNCIHFLELQKTHHAATFEIEECIAWLEKQGKQMTADNAEPKFHEGDWIVWQDKYYKVNYNGCGYELVDQNGLITSLEYGTIEENAHLWTILDAKDGDVLVCCDDKPFIFKGFFGIGFPNCLAAYCGITSNNQFIHCNGKTFWTNQDVRPATKEQRELLFQKMKEAGFKWDDDKKELKKIEQKPTDKDETKFHECEWISDNKKYEPIEDNRPVTERIKTFDDACNALGDEHPLVTQYRLTAAAYKGDPMTQDLIAYLKLRIIVAALNEGWEPKFEKDEYRYYPWFYLYTKEQYDELDNEKKRRCVLRSGNLTFSFSGFVGCNANNDASVSSAYNGSRLAFRTRKLAEYAGRQFIEEWTDFVFKSE